MLGALACAPKDIADLFIIIPVGINLFVLALVSIFVRVNALLLSLIALLLFAMLEALAASSKDACACKDEPPGEIWVKGLDLGGI